jgi:hypothetical protein
MTLIDPSPRAFALAVALVFAPAACRDGGANAHIEQSKPPAAPTAATTKPAPSAPKSPFDAKRAFENVRKQVSFGPRPAGSPALGATRDWIKSELSSYGLEVREEKFTGETPKGPVKMSNVIAELPGKSPNVLVIASHYDTKLMPGFVGANDGGSSTGVLLEIARVAAAEFKEKKLDLTLQFVFFDGEEAVVQWTEDDSTYGSRYFVESREDDGSLDKLKGLVLLDMIGDKDLVVEREGYSTPELADVIWKAAGELGYGSHFATQKHYIEDDHKPFLEAGVPAVDLIDFTYGTDQKYGSGGPTNAYWHTTEDTLDKLSPESMQVIGDTILVAIPRLVALLAR